MATAKKLEWLAGGGQMADVIAAVDWSSSPLGRIESWPQSLRTTVSLCLASNFPINIIWGDEHNQIYNDGYRVVCGAVHPRAIGEDYRVTWASAWPAIGEPFERALAGETTYLENQRMFLERNGYPEETFFTFSLSPIRDESGKVVGLFHPVTETTATMLGERRTRALRDIADGAGSAWVLERACDLLLETLGANALDVPFALLYLASPDGKVARLHGACGTPKGGPVAPPLLTLAASEASWPLAAAARGGRIYPVSDMAARFGGVVAGPYPEAVSTSFVLPLRVGGAGEPLGYLVVGVSPRLPLDKGYEGFVAMLGAAATAALGNARAYEIEKRRSEDLAELDRAKTAFFSNVSHEFRTPLTLLLGPLEDLLGGSHGALSDGVRHELAVVRRNALRLLKLVNALLDFSRVEAGRAAASFQATDLSALTRAIATMFSSAVERAGLGFVIDVESIPDPVLVDREMWEKIVLNLVSNAFKFTHTGEITVKLRRVDEFAELRVEDTGIGIAETELGRVFERFHRVHAASGRTHEGSGIGLALVHDLAKLHGGSANVESVHGKGSTFSVRIPLASAERASNAVASAPQSPSGGVRSEAFVEEAVRWLPDAAGPSEAQSQTSVSAVGRPRILLVDDNADMRDYVRRLLAVHYDVIAVKNGAEALAALRRERPSLVLSDLMMPVMDGAELVAHLRADESLRTIPVILLSARAGDEATASGLELGADDYLTKPFSARELLARVRSQLNMAAMRAEAAEQAALVTNLAQQQRWLEAVLDRLPVPTTLLDLETGIFTFANRAAHEMAGGRFPTHRDDAERSAAFRLTDDQNVPLGAESTPAARVHRGEELRGAEVVWHSPAGRFDLLVDSGAVPAIGIQSPRTIITFQDISRLKQVERELKSLLAARDEFLAMASHELKTPMTSLRMQLQMAERDTALDGAASSAPENLAKRIRVSNKQVDRLAALVDDLLDVARIRTGRLQLTLEPTDLVALVREVLERFSAQIASSQSTVRLESPPALKGVWDARRLEQVFANVMTNAFKYAPGNPLDVRIAADAADGVVLAVRDFGPGVDPAVSNTIFDRFDRGLASRNTGGLGLGLFISKQIVRAHGGDMAVVAPPGGGACFVVRLPRDARVAAAVARSSGVVT